MAQGPAGNQRGCTGTAVGKVEGRSKIEIQQICTNVHRRFTDRLSLMFDCRAVHCVASEPWEMPHQYTCVCTVSQLRAGSSQAAYQRAALPCYQWQLCSDLAHNIFNGPYIKRADPLHMPGDFTSSPDYLESPCTEPSLNLIKTIKMKRLIGGNCHWSRRGGRSGDSVTTI